MKKNAFTRLRVPALLAVACLLGSLAVRPLVLHVEELAADARFLLRYKTRKVFTEPSEQPNAKFPGVSNDICLIAIDDYTLLQLGKYGSGPWAVREPFCNLLHALSTYQPSTVAFDILFRPAGEQEAGGRRKVPDTRELRRMFKTMAERPEDDFSASTDELLAMTRFSALQAETNLATELLFLTQPPPNATYAGIPVICAYDLQSEKLGDNPNTFNHADMYGPDPKSKDHKKGETIPYLLDVAIPAVNIHDTPEDYEYATNATLPSKVIRDSAQHGYINVPRDNDGIIRRIPLVFGFTYGNKGAFAPSMALLCVMNHLKLKPDDVHVFFGDSIRLRLPPPRRELNIPIDREGNMYLNYAGRVPDFHSITMAYVIEAGLKNVYLAKPGTPEADAHKKASVLRGKICPVGLTATGTTDIGPCPIDSNTPYVHIHMTAIGNILTGRFLTPTSLWVEAAILLLISLLGFLASLPSSIPRTVLATVVLLVGYHTFAFVLFWNDIAILPAATPTICIASLFLGVFMHRYVTEVRERKRIRAMFSTAVSPLVLKFMEEHPKQALAGQRMDATVMFSDIAGFTSISERLAPEQLTQMLKEYFNAMTDVILDEKDCAYIDKFIGDAVMAVWGAPLSMAGHEKTACRAVLRQRDAIERLTPIFLEKYGVNFGVRIGLNSGPVVAGEMGSQKKSQYTVMGDTVNQAARFEPANKDYGTAIMIGESTREKVGDEFVVRMLDKIVVTGKTKPVGIYELVAEANAPIPEDRKQLIKLYEDALHLHWDRKWDEAEACLHQALTLIPEEKACLNLLERIGKYRQAPPPEGWLGEYVRTSKH